jgi:hypothetical protein
MISFDDKKDHQNFSAARLFGLSIATVTALSIAAGDPPVAAADEGAPVVINCSQPPQVKPDSHRYARHNRPLLIDGTLTPGDIASVSLKD